MTATYPPSVAVFLTPEQQCAGLAADVRRGLGADVKWLPAKWLYDERGCDLFEQITALPEYYPT
ncbi:MAG: L-histidine N(alpha)-methyltransferase, partial [Actinomycetes bacterium]